MKTGEEGRLFHFILESGALERDIAEKLICGCFTLPQAVTYFSAVPETARALRKTDQPFRLFD